MGLNFFIIFLLFFVGINFIINLEWEFDESLVVLGELVVWLLEIFWLYEIIVKDRVSSEVYKKLCCNI